MKPPVPADLILQHQIALHLVGPTSEQWIIERTLMKALYVRCCSQLACALVTSYRVRCIVQTQRRIKPMPWMKSKMDGRPHQRWQAHHWKKRRSQQVFHNTQQMQRQTRTPWIDRLDS